MIFAILTNDEGDITLLSYDWCHTVTLTAHVQRRVGLWNESRPFFSYVNDAEIAASLLRLKLEELGFTFNDSTEWDNFVMQLKQLCEPNGGVSQYRQLTFHVNRNDNDNDN